MGRWAKRGELQMRDFLKLSVYTAIVLFSAIGVADFALWMGGYEMKREVEIAPHAWFTECVTRGNDPMWCRASEKLR